MRTIIAGSRGLGLDDVRRAMIESQSISMVTVIISGTARGVDQAGEAWALEHGIPVERFAANWDLHGKSAGYRRNVEMAEHADALVAVWDGQSRGTQHMIRVAREKNLWTFVWKV